MAKKNSKKLLDTSADSRNKAGSPKKVKANMFSRYSLPHISHILTQLTNYFSSI